MISVKQLKELIEYDRFTGVILWRKNKARAVKGNLAGSLDSGGYLTIKINQNKYQASRLAWFYVNGSFPIGVIDHINGDILDNRLCNLRDVTPHDNARNRKIYNTNTSGICGVSWCKKWNKWVVKISKNKVSINIGGFGSLFDAACVRKSKEIEFGYHENHGKR